MYVNLIRDIIAYYLQLSDFNSSEVNRHAMNFDILNKRAME